MNKHKLDYEAPEASTFVVRFEGNLLAGSDYDSPGVAPGLGEDEDNGGF